MNNYFNNTGFFSWLWKHWIMLLFAQILAVAAAIVITLPYFMPPEYKSYAIVYPYNLSTYSRESATEQLLQFLASTDIKNEVIKDFNLVKHYKIDTTEKYWYSRLLTEYDRKVVVNPTEYEAVQIDVYDVSQDTAYLIVNDIIRVVNKTILTAQREKSEETAKLLKRQLDIKKKEVDSLSATARMLSVQYGLLDYPNQTREVEKAYYAMLASSKGGKPFDEASAQIKNLEEKGEVFKEVDQHLGSAVGDYDALLLKYEDAVRDMNKQLTFTSVVAKPYPADKKAYPLRWMYVLLMCVSMFVISVVILKIIEKTKQQGSPS